MNRIQQPDQQHSAHFFQIILDGDTEEISLKSRK